MRVLLDECVNRRLARHLAGHEARTVPQMGWSGIKNGRLLGLAQHEFDVFLTLDQHLSEQQHLPRFQIAVVVLTARSNALHDLLEILEPLLTVLPTAPKGAATRVPE